MVDRELREVATCDGHRLMSDGWAYYDVREGPSRPEMVGYYEDDFKAIKVWADRIGEAMERRRRAVTLHESGVPSSVIARRLGMERAEVNHIVKDHVRKAATDGIRD